MNESDQATEYLSATNFIIIIEILMFIQMNAIFRTSS